MVQENQNLQIKQLIDLICSKSWSQQASETIGFKVSSSINNHKQLSIKRRRYHQEAHLRIMASQRGKIRNDWAMEACRGKWTKSPITIIWIKRKFKQKTLFKCSRSTTLCGPLHPTNKFNSSQGLRSAPNSSIQKVPLRKWPRKLVLIYIISSSGLLKIKSHKLIGWIPSRWWEMWSQPNLTLKSQRANSLCWRLQRFKNRDCLIYD